MGNSKLGDSSFSARRAEPPRSRQSKSREVDDNTNHWLLLLPIPWESV